MSYIGQIPLPQATEERIERTATAGQTSFTGLTYVNGFISVYLNGVKLDNADFTATDGTTVTLGTGAAAGDTVSFVSTTQTSALMSLPLKDSAGNSILSESGGVVTLGNATLGSSVTFPAGSTISGQIGGGHILQVQQKIKSDTFSHGNNTPTAVSGLDCDITVGSANNYVLVIVSLGVAGSQNSGVANFQIRCDGSTFNLPTGATQNIHFGQYINNSYLYVPQSFAILHSPGIGSHTYQPYISSDTATVYVNRRVQDTFVAGVSTITLLEVQS